MKITRNGVEIELTPEEMREAYWAQEAEYTKEDLERCLDEEVIEEIPEKLDEKTRQELLDKAAYHMTKLYDDNPLRGDLYWEARREALEDAWKEIKPAELAEEAPDKIYHVNFVVDGRYDIAVVANSPEKAKVAAENIFMETEFPGLEIVKSFCQYAEDDNGNMEEFV